VQAVKTVLCTTAPWAYGSTTTLISVARRMSGKARLVYLGGGIALECARGYAFDDFVEMDVRAPDFGARVRPVLDRVDVVLSCMNFSILEPAHRAGKPCVLWDALGWMWDRPQVPRTLSMYFVERFPGLDRNLRAWSPDLPAYEVIGPVISDQWAGTQEKRDRLLVNFSGLRQYLMPGEVERAYGEGMWATLRLALPAWNGEVLVAGGQDLVRRLRELAQPDLPGGRLRFESLAHEEYLRGLDASSAAVTSAGMRALYEAFTYGVPCGFLPPQNMSQELTLKVLEEAGATASPPTWSSLYGLEDVRGMDQESGVRLVNECVLRFAGDRRAQAAVAASLAEFLRDPERVRAGQREFMRSLGELGTDRVAELTLSLAHRPGDLSGAAPGQG
jgi:hypothetical protein